jgi:hypothetical protein
MVERVLGEPLTVDDPQWIIGFSGSHGRKTPINLARALGGSCKQDSWQIAGMF